MITIPAGSQIWIAAGITDLRRGFDGLSSLVQMKLEQVPFGGHVFVGWEHKIVVEKRLAPEPGHAYPGCLAGERHAPPEDCGGIPGFYNLLEAMGDPEHEQHEELLDWLGDGFDPEAFSVEEVKRMFWPSPSRRPISSTGPASGRRPLTRREVSRKARLVPCCREPARSVG